MVNNMNKKVRLRYDRIVICIFALVVILIFVVKGISFALKKINPEMKNIYLASTSSIINLYDKDKNKISDIFRGSKASLYVDSEKDELVKIKIADKNYYVEKKAVVDDYNKVVLDNKIYLRTMTTLLNNNTKIEEIVPKGATLEIVGFDKLEKGNPIKYKVKYGAKTGYIDSKYLVSSLEEANKNYDEEGIQKIHAKKSSTYGGKAGELDFYPREKPKFKDNIMPEKVRAFYLNGSAIRKIDEYLEIAKGTNVNAFIVDIKDDYLAYKSEVAQKLTPSSYKTAISSVEKYKSYIQKIKDNGYYVVGRITLFKDRNYALDNVSDSITDNSGNLYKHNGSYWPSAFNTNVWEYNINLALEAVELFGFNEIQFDYVRFPDGTSSVEKSGTINMKNQYNISKIQAIQTFLMYAVDILHEKGVYVSADVFGESAHEYVNSYGQYWGAISNVVDVISAMPYPDHFLAHQYGIAEVVWTNPYKLLTVWCKNYAMKRQSEIPTPAIMRTWIQAYNTSKSPSVIYDSKKIEEQIKALEESGATGGYMTWSASSSMVKYKEIANSL